MDNSILIRFLTVAAVLRELGLIFDLNNSQVFIYYINNVYKLESCRFTVKSKSDDCDLKL